MNWERGVYEKKTKRGSFKVVNPGLFRKGFAYELPWRGERGDKSVKKKVRSAVVGRVVWGVSSTSALKRPFRPPTTETAVGNGTSKKRKKVYGPRAFGWFKKPSHLQFQR